MSVDTSKSGAQDGYQSLQALERAISVLEIIAANAEHGCRLADIIERAGLGRATTHRFVRSLQALGLIELEERSARYFPGVRLAALGMAGINRFGIAQRASIHLKRLAELTEDTVYLTVRIDDETMCVARREGAFPIKTLTVRPGDRRPLGVGAGGLALLAFIEPPSDLEALLRAAGPQISGFGLDTATLSQMVSTSRELGYALNDGRLILGMTGIGFPVGAPGGHPVAALSVAAISSRMNAARRPIIAQWLAQEARALEHDLAPLLQQASTGGSDVILTPAGR